MKVRMSALALFASVLIFSYSVVSAQSTLASYAKANPKNPEVLNSYGIELANSGDLTGAIRVWRRALDFSPTNVHLYNNIGSALKRMGHDEHAFKWYSAALIVKPVYWTYYNLALLYRDRGQMQEAIWSLKRSLELKNDFIQAKDLLSRIKSGLIAPDLGAPGTSTVVKTPVTSPEKDPLKAVETTAKIVRTKVPQAKMAAFSVRMPVKKKTPHYSATMAIKAEKVLRLPDDKGGQVFLTFDGGADDDGFNSILASLAKYQVKCTFFLTGQFVENYPTKARKLLSEGHEIANHSMSHPDMKKFSAEKISAEIEAAERVFEKALGQRGAPFFRFPFGHQNLRVEKIVETLGYRPVYWHIDTIDWREDSVKTIISRVNKKLRRGSVILMHLGSKNGAKALDSILEIISVRGYKQSRLSDLDPSMLASLP